MASHDVFAILSTFFNEKDVKKIKVTRDGEELRKFIIFLKSVHQKISMETFQALLAERHAFEKEIYQALKKSKEKWKTSLEYSTKIIAKGEKMKSHPAALVLTIYLSEYMLGDSYLYELQRLFSTITPEYKSELLNEVRKSGFKDLIYPIFKEASNK